MQCEIFALKGVAQAFGVKPFLVAMCVEGCAAIVAFVPECCDCRRWGATCAGKPKFQGLLRDTKKFGSFLPALGARDVEAVEISSEKMATLLVCSMKVHGGAPE